MKKRTGWLLNAVLGFSVIFSSSAALVPIRSFAAEETSETAGADTAKEDLAGLKYDHSLELQYADQFAVDYYEGDYALITIEGGDQFLLVPEGKEAPDGLDADITGRRRAETTRILSGSPTKNRTPSAWTISGSSW